MPLIIPIDTAVRSQGNDLASRSQAATPSSPEAQHLSAPGPQTAVPRTILYAEDNDDLRTVVQLFLEVMGYTVIACADALIAEKTFHLGAAVDMLLTDIEMPGRSGIELARHLTAIRPSLPVLIVSGCSLTSAVEREIQSRNWSFLGKPVRLPALMARIEILLTSSADPATFGSPLLSRAHTLPAVQQLRTYLPPE